jgi:hypothetical protein
MADIALRLFIVTTSLNEWLLIFEHFPEIPETKSVPQGAINGI